MSYPQGFRTEPGLQPLGNFDLGGEEEGGGGAVFAPRDCTHPLPQISAGVRDPRKFAVGILAAASMG